MLIQCTKKLLDELKKKPEEQVEEEGLLTSWHGNIINLNRKKTLVLVNDKNRYTIVLHGLKAKDLKKLDDLIVSAIKETFKSEGIKDEVIEQYILAARKLKYTKTKDRKMVARMNKGVENAQHFEDLLDSSSILQPNLSVRISSLLVGDGSNDYFNPNEALYKDLEEMAGEPVISMRAYDLLVTMQLKNHRVFRRVIAPTMMTFAQLHDTLQIVFDWKNYHLHEFYIYGDGEKSIDPALINHPAYDEEGRKPIINLVGYDDDFFDWEDDGEAVMQTESGPLGGIPKKLDYRVKLSDFLPAKVKYIYDFGDHWVHNIEVLREIENFPQNYPLCVEGEGESPPEDVGGERGYEEFMKVIGNPTHPDNIKMVTWSLSQGKFSFDLGQVNKRLKLRY